MKLVLVLAAALVTAAPGLALPLGDAERAAFRSELRAYLMEHPEVIREALDGAEKRRMARHANADLALIEANSSALFYAPDDWTGGAPDGDVTLVSFVDYRADGSDRALAAARDAAARDGRLRLVVKEAPSPGDEAAERAARFAMAVLRLAGPTAYEAAQARLFAAGATPEAATLDRISADLGMDPAEVRARMAGPDITAKLSETRALAEALDLGPAPAQVMKRTMVRGDVPAVALLRMVEAIRRKK
ncbi:DsbA family protein [Rhodovulum sp. MB263]|uniref:DsbA family protein n=1 Tax=Rhodovulum sp. (strain MB263) TaxID=308754 RepID=UPI0009B72CDF|nr:DsbA family protein [Rhodovulum sp. MB263]ARC88094.1 hypothetical protein B5V46_05475 [Rhodovulum sp. MB263]